MTSKTDRAFVSHLLKRTSYNVSRVKIDGLVKLSRNQLVAQLVDKAPGPSISPNPVLLNREGDTYPDFIAIVEAELARLSSAQSGLGDRMLWFWHGLLTSSYPKVNFPGLLWRQHQLIAKYALGNVRQLLIELSTDPAMLLYLDGNYSYGSNPNENYARELMELFTLGPGNYTQDDVSAAAKVFSGWRIEGLPKEIGQQYSPKSVGVKYHADLGYGDAVSFFGKTGVYNIPALIDRILQQEASALFIVERLFKYFVHDQPSASVLQELARIFRNSAYQIRPVLARLFRLPEFTSAAAMSGRARLPLEWLLAVLKATGLNLDQVQYDSFLYSSGQVPFSPVNVQGWPTGARWLSGTVAMRRSALAIRVLGLDDSPAIIKCIARADNPINETLKWLSLMQVSEQTMQQLQMANQQMANRFDRARLLLSLAIAAPEFALT